MGGALVATVARVLRVARRKKNTDMLSTIVIPSSAAAMITHAQSSGAPISRRTFRRRTRSRAVRLRRSRTGIGEGTA
jgi:hypothetical protein